MPPGIEAHFGRGALEGDKTATTYFKLGPDFHPPFGHRHGEQEEVYVVISGNARAKIGDEVIDLRQWDTIRIAPGAWRGLAGGSEGAEVIAFGAPNTENKDIEMSQDFWS
jgi:mannose-6-phosphate isomerase-like protein (cupin superfamily)